MTKPTPQEMSAALACVRAIHELMMEIGAGGIPTGHLYARFMATGMDLPTFQSMEAMCIRVGICEKKGDVLFPGEVVRNLKEANGQQASR